MLSEKQQIWGTWLSAKNLTHGKSMGILDYIKCRYSKTAFWKNIETWHVGLSWQCTHFMSFSSKSEHVTLADQATLKLGRIKQVDIKLPAQEFNTLTLAGFKATTFRSHNACLLIDKIKCWKSIENHILYHKQKYYDWCQTLKWVIVIFTSQL